MIYQWLVFVHVTCCSQWSCFWKASEFRSDWERQDTDGRSEASFSFVLPATGNTHSVQAWEPADESVRFKGWGMQWRDDVLDFRHFFKSTSDFPCEDIVSLIAAVVDSFWKRFLQYVAPRFFPLHPVSSFAIEWNGCLIRKLLFCSLDVTETHPSTASCYHNSQLVTRNLTDLTAWGLQCQHLRGWGWCVRCRDVQALKRISGWASRADHLPGWPHGRQKTKPNGWTGL